MAPRKISQAPALNHAPGLSEGRGGRSREARRGYARAVGRSGGPVNQRMLALLYGFLGLNQADSLLLSPLVVSCTTASSLAVVRSITPSCSAETAYKFQFAA